MQRLVHFTFAALVIMIGMLLPSQAAPIETDVNIVTGLDISDSVSADDVVLQIDGIAAAVRSPEFLRAIGGGPNRRIGFAVFAWHQGQFPKVLGWRIIANSTDAEAVAQQVEQRHNVNLDLEARRRGNAHAGPAFSTLPPYNDGVPFYFTGRLTDTSSAIDHGAHLLAAAPFTAARNVINIVGEGEDNVGEEPVKARDRAVTAGMTINGVVIGHNPDALAYYRSQVIGGRGAFVMPVDSRQSIVEAMKRKFLGDLLAWGSSGLKPLSEERRYVPTQP